MTTSMGRGPATREALVERAADLFRERGFRATSVLDVAEGAGIPKGSLYHHFPSKEHLGYAVLDHWRHQFQTRFFDEMARDDATPALDRVGRFLDRFLDAQRDGACRGGCPFGTLAAEMADVHEGFRRRLAATFQGFADALAAQLRRARADGALRADADPDALGTFLVATLEGGALLAKVHRSPDALASALDTARSHLERFRVPTPPPPRSV